MTMEQLDLFRRVSMPTIMVDPEDAGTQTGEWLPPPPDWKPTPISEQLGEPIDPEGDCCVLNGSPCILFGMWDYAEDWSGEFVRDMHPFALLSAPEITREQFWKLVRAKNAEAKWKVQPAGLIS